MQKAGSQYRNHKKSLWRKPGKKPKRYIRSPPLVELYTLGFFIFRERRRDR